MKKILVRAGINPLAPSNEARIVNRNLIGGNVGNLIYANSVYRTLMVSDDTELVCDNYSMNENDAPWINENCSAYIIPLADLFRESGLSERNRIKKLVRKLNIPCIILGVGIRAKNEKAIENGFPFDDDVKDFVNTVLDKSAMVGLRGELTAKYLTQLGFKEDKDFMVIGCPSMYTYGAYLKRCDKPLNITKDSAISVNASVVATKENLAFVFGLFDEYKNSVFIPQRQGELLTLYTGRDYEHPCNKPIYPIHLTDKLYAENRVKMFLQAKQWIDYLSTKELSIGCRMHGNIAAILAGIPTVIIPHDMRMKELIDYHRLPSLRPGEIKECSTLDDVLERVDFDAMFNHHQENFERYRKFLKINDIDNIFAQNDIVRTATYDLALAKLGGDYEVKSAAFASPQELMDRMNALDSDNKELIENLKESTRDLNGKFKALNTTSIKNDVKCLRYKISDKVRGVRHTNLEIKQIVCNKD